MQSKKSNKFLLFIGGIAVFILEEFVLNIAGGFFSNISAGEYYLTPTSKTVFCALASTCAIIIFTLITFKASLPNKQRFLNLSNMGVLKLLTRDLWILLIIFGISYFLTIQHLPHYVHPLFSPREYTGTVNVEEARLRPQLKNGYCVNYDFSFPEIADTTYDYKFCSTTTPYSRNKLLELSGTKSTLGFKITSARLIEPTTAH
jgi:hypothetical protein